MKDVTTTTEEEMERRQIPNGQEAIMATIRDESLFTS